MRNNIPKTLEKRIKSQKDGISLFEYINYCLYDEKDGYYSNLFKVSKDFVTSPEISQLFGECVTIFFLYAKKIFENKKKSKIQSVVEFGPGNGTLMSDVIRTLDKKYCLNEWSFFLIEISKLLKRKQKDVLFKYKKKTNIFWKKNLNKSFNNCCFYLCNEFFDAFPFNQFSSKGMKRIIIKQNKLIPVFVPTSNCHKPINSNEIIESSLFMKKFVFKIFKKIKKNGGIFLLIDYGPLIKKNTDTIQAIHNNLKCNFLDHPGRSDITHHIDFVLLKKIAKRFGLRVYGPVNQSKFLSIFGINERTENLINKSNNLKQKEKIENDFLRLTSYNQMGELYKCIIFSDVDLNLPF